MTENIVMVGDFPSEIRVGDEAMLTIHFERVAGQQNGQTRIRLQEEFDLVVVPGSCGKLENRTPACGTVRIPPEGESSRIGFIFKGLEEGPVSISAMAVLKGTTVAGVKLLSKVVPV